MYRYFHSSFLMANLWNSEAVVKFCFLFVVWHFGPVGENPAYISDIQTLEEDPLVLLPGECTTPPESTSWLETFARLAFLSQKEGTFKSTLKCVNIRHSLVLGMYFEQAYWCMLGSSQIGNCGTLNLCISVCMFWYLPNIHVTKIYFGNGLTSGTTNHLDNKPKINLSTSTIDGMEIMASWISWFPGWFPNLKCRFDKIPPTLTWRVLSESSTRWLQDLPRNGES